MRPVRGEDTPQVDDFSAIGIEADTQFVPPGAQDHRDEIARAPVLLHRGRKGQVGEDVAIVDDEGLLPGEPVPQVVESSGGVEQDRFMTEQDRTTAIDPAGKGDVIGLGQWWVFTANDSTRDRE